MKNKFIKPLLTIKPLLEEEAKKFKQEWLNIFQGTGNVTFFDSSSKIEFTSLKKFRLPRKKKKALKKGLEKIVNK